MRGPTRADSAKNPERFVAVIHELGARYERLARDYERSAADRRAASVLAAARASSMMDAERCAGATRVRAGRLVRAHPEWSDDALTTILCGWIQRGMTAEQLTASWGRPGGGGIEQGLGRGRELALQPRQPGRRGSPAGAPAAW